MGTTYAQVSLYLAHPITIQVTEAIAALKEARQIVSCETIARRTGLTTFCVMGTLDRINAWEPLGIERPALPGSSSANWH